MPKKRIKRSGNISKSGTLTQNFRKELKVDSHLNNFVLRDIFHNQSKKDLDKVIFDDSKTIFFDNKVVNATLGIEKSYIEGDYLENNKLVNTPNLLDHNSTYEVTKIVRPEDYSHVLYSNYENELGNDKNKPFNDAYVDYELLFDSEENNLINEKTDYEKIIYNFKRSRYEIKRNYEEIDINFDKNIACLSFNLNDTVNEYSNGLTGEKDLPFITYPATSNWGGNKNYFLALNDNTIYLDNNKTNDKNTFYSLGDPRSNYFSSALNFFSSPITHNPLTIYPNDKILGNATYTQGLDDLSSISNPIYTFGFPWARKFRGNDEVEINASDYINEDFILEKVHVEFGIQNFSISLDSTHPCFNTLNFFILNQRGNIDIINSQWVAQAQGVDSVLLNTNIWNNNSLTSFSTSGYVNPNFESKILRKKFERPFVSSDFTSQKKIDPSTVNLHPSDVYSAEIDSWNQITRKFQQRELITNIKIANIGNIIKNDVPIPYDQSSYQKKLLNSLEGVDAVIYSDNENSITHEGQTVVDHILNDDFKSIKITSNVTSYRKSKSLKRFSEFEIYPSGSNKRSGYDFESERSINSENNMVELTGNTFNDENGIRVDVGRAQKDRVSYNELTLRKDNNPYILKPKDKLIFGFNFCPGMNLANEDVLNSSTDKNQYMNYNGRDVILLDLRNLKIKLLGRYVAENKSFVPKKKEFENKNIKKINEFSTNVVDKIGLPRPYLLKGAYYNSYINDPSYYPNGISTDARRFGYFLNIPIDPDIEFPDGWYQKYDFSGNLKVHPPLNPDMWHYSGGGYLEDTISDSVRTDFRLADRPFRRLLNGNKLEFDKYLYYRYNVDHFGFISDKVNHNTHYAYVEDKTGKTTFNTTKFFRLKGFYIQKDPVANPIGTPNGEEHKINSYNKDMHSRVTDSLFKEV